MATRFIVVLTTLPTRAKARRMATLVLKEKMAACVNLVGPAESFFWWQGKVDQAKEYLLLIKTRTSHFVRIQKFLEKHHPYSVPEIVALPIQKGNTSYLSWLEESVR